MGDPLPCSCFCPLDDAFGEVEQTGGSSAEQGKVGCSGHTLVSRGVTHCPWVRSNVSVSEWLRGAELLVGVKPQ